MTDIIWPDYEMLVQALEEDLPDHKDNYLDRLYVSLSRYGAWMTPTGKTKKVIYMDDTHLANAINMLKRDYDLRNDSFIIQYLCKEVNQRKKRDEWNPKSSKFNQLENFMEQEDNSMNNGFNMKNVAALVRDDITTVRVTHDNTSKVYTYKITKELAKQLEAGDLVLVKNAHGVTTGTVEKIHSEPEIEIQGATITAWVFQKVDTAEVEQLEKDDRLIEKRISKLQAKSARDQALAALGIQADQTQGLLEQVRKEEDDDDII